MSYSSASADLYQEDRDSTNLEQSNFTYPESGIVPSNRILSADSCEYESPMTTDLSDSCANPSTTGDSDFNLHRSISRGATRGRLHNLDEFCTRMYEASVPGPYVTTDVHLGNKLLGKGAQFHVYGSEHVLADPELYAAVDRPYKAVALDVRGRRRRLVLAIKRPVFDIPTGPMPATDPEVDGGE